MVDFDYDVFISYSQKDRGLALRLVDSLELPERDWSVYLDEVEIQSGDEWRIGIVSAHVVLLLITPNYLAHDRVERQLPYLLNAAYERGIFVLPILGDALPYQRLVVFHPVNPERTVREMRPRELNAFAERLSRDITGLLRGEPSLVARYRSLEPSFEPEVPPHREADLPGEETIPRKHTPSRGTIYVGAQDVIDALQKETGASVELSQCFLTAWVGLLRYAALEKAEEEGRLSEFLDQVGMGEGSLRMSQFLAPLGWNHAAFVQQISRDIHLRPEDTYRMLDTVCQTLVIPTDRRESLEFEPLGIIRRASRDETRYGKEKLASGFSIELRKDFFAPQMHESVTVQETESPEECGENYIGT